MKAPLISSYSSVPQSPQVRYVSKHESLNRNNFNRSFNLDHLIQLNLDQFNPNKTETSIQDQTIHEETQSYLHPYSNSSQNNLHTPSIAIQPQNNMTNTSQIREKSCW